MSTSRHLLLVHGVGFMSKFGWNLEAAGKFHLKKCMSRSNGAIEFFFVDLAASDGVQVEVGPNTSHGHISWVSTRFFAS